jgi:tetratricopeptide (TPR) repeat protein
MSRWLTWLMLCVGLAVHTAAAPAYKDEFARLEKALAAQPTNTALLFEIADLCHDEGVHDNKEAVKRAEKFLRDLLKLDATNAPALALLGSTYTMKGRDAFWPTTQISLVKQGNKFMDDAVQLAPDHARVRLIRGLNNVHMPGWLGREKVALDDLTWLWKRIATAPAEFTEKQRQEVALQYGIALRKAKRTPEAVAAWKAGIAMNERTRYAAEMRKHLEKEM